MFLRENAVIKINKVFMVSQALQLNLHLAFPSFLWATLLHPLLMLPCPPSLRPLHGGERTRWKSLQPIWFKRQGKMPKQPPEPGPRCL